MKIRFLLLVSCLSAYLYPASAQSTRFDMMHDFSRDFVPGNSVASNILPDTGSFLVAGQMAAYPFTSQCSYLARFDYNGQKIWQKELFFPGMYNRVNGTSALIRLGPDRVLLAGVDIDAAIRDSIAVYQPFLYMVNNNGDSVRFVKFVDSLEARTNNTVTFTSDHQIVAAGQTYFKTKIYNTWERKFEYDSNAVYVARYDTLGNKVWERRFFGGKSSTIANYNPCKILPAENGSCLIAVAGNVPSLPAGAQYSSFIMKIDAAGNLLWRKNYRFNGFPEMPGIDICRAAKGGYYFVVNKALGPAAVNGPQSSVLCYGHITPDGDTTWTRSFAQPGGALGYKWSQCANIRQDAGGNLLLTANVYYDARMHPTLVITDSLGNIKSYREYIYYSPFVDQQLHALQVTPRHEVLMAGYLSATDPATWNDTVGNYARFLLTDSLGCLYAGCAAADTVWQLGVGGSLAVEPGIAVFPNPATDLVTVQLNGLEGAQLLLTDLSGRTVLCRTLKHQKQEVPVAQLPPGLYLLRVATEKGTAYRCKLLKQ